MSEYINFTVKDLTEEQKLTMKIYFDKYSEECKNSKDENGTSSYGMDGEVFTGRIFFLDSNDSMANEKSDNQRSIVFSEAVEKWIAFVSKMAAATGPEKWDVWFSEYQFEWDSNEKLFLLNI